MGIGLSRVRPLGWIPGLKSPALCLWPQKQRMSRENIQSRILDAFLVSHEPTITVLTVLRLLLWPDSVSGPYFSFSIIFAALLLIPIHSLPLPNSIHHSNAKKQKNNWAQLMSLVMLLFDYNHLDSKFYCRYITTEMWPKFTLFLTGSPISVNISTILLDNNNLITNFDDRQFY